MGDGVVDGIVSTVASSIVTTTGFVCVLVIVINFVTDGNDGLEVNVRERGEITSDALGLGSLIGGQSSGQVPIGHGSTPPTTKQ